MSRIENPFFSIKYGTKNGSLGLNQNRKQNERRIGRSVVLFVVFAPTRIFFLCCVCVQARAFVLIN